MSPGQENEQDQSKLNDADYRIVFYEYRELCALERKKSSIYSQLFTIFATGMGGASAFYFNDPGNAFILLIIPVLAIFWGAFTAFNSCYLKVLRTEIKRVEEGVLREKLKTKWFSGKFSSEISGKIVSPLFLLCAVVIIFILYYCLANTGVAIESLNVEKNSVGYFKNIYYGVILLLYIMVIGSFGWVWVKHN